jgi:hypothetical protein
MGKPGCVYTIAPIVGFLIVPYFDENGAKTFISLSDVETIGATLLERVQADSTDPRLYPTPRLRNVEPTRSDSVYETDAGGERFKIEGVGGVYTIASQLWDKDAAFAILRELKKYGCTALGVFPVDKKGQIWVKKEDPSSPFGYSMKMATSTFDAFAMLASDTTVAKTMINFDLDQTEDFSDMYPITAEQLQYDPTTELIGNGLVSASQTADTPQPSATTLAVRVYDAFGTATDTGDITGLVVGNFKVINKTDNTVITPSSAVETEDGYYLLTFVAQTTGDILVSRVSGAFGYEVADSNEVTSL